MRQRFFVGSRNGIIGVMCAAAAFCADVGNAQDFYGQMNAIEQNMAALDAQMRQHMAETANRARQAQASYIEQNRPQLEREHQQFVQSTGQQISLEQYVEFKVSEEAARRMNAQNPTGYNPIFEAQKRQFAAGQAAHQQRQATYDAQNNAWWAQQQQNQRSHDRFIQQGIQGNQFYRNTETGQVAELPFAGDTGVYGNPSGDTWLSGQMGQFNQVGPNGELQEMEAYEPEDYGGGFFGE